MSTVEWTLNGLILSGDYTSTGVDSITLVGIEDFAFVDAWYLEDLTEGMARMIEVFYKRFARLPQSVEAYILDRASTDILEYAEAEAYQAYYDTYQD
jgi:hypothetical protein